MKLKSKAAIIAYKAVKPFYVEIVNVALPNNEILIQIKATEI